MNEVRVGGACGPPPPFVAPLVPRCALTSGATPRDVLDRRLRLAKPKALSGRASRSRFCRSRFSSLLSCRASRLRFSRVRFLVSIIVSGVAFAFLSLSFLVSICRVPAAASRVTGPFTPYGREVAASPPGIAACRAEGGGQHVAGGRPGSECAARNERSNERGRGAAGSPDPDHVRTSEAYGSPDPDYVRTSEAYGSPDPDYVLAQITG
jgi:hypothetical protein